MSQRNIIVEVLIKVQDINSAEKIKTAVNSYFSSSDGGYVFSEIRDGGIHGNELMLVFFGDGHDHKEIADSVHLFLNSFMDEFYDDTLEDDWLNEMDCDEMPIIVGYEVNAAKDYVGKDNN